MNNNTSQPATGASETARFCRCCYSFVPSSRITHNALSHYQQDNTATKLALFSRFNPLFPIPSNADAFLRPPSPNSKPSLSNPPPNTPIRPKMSRIHPFLLSYPDKVTQEVQKFQLHKSFGCIHRVHHNLRISISAKGQTLQNTRPT